jgi:hypothetical protein
MHDETVATDLTWKWKLRLDCMGEMLVVIRRDSQGTSELI